MADEHLPHLAEAPSSADAKHPAGASSVVADTLKGRVVEPSAEFPDSEDSKEKELWVSPHYLSVSSLVALQKFPQNYKDKDNR